MAQRIADTVKSALQIRSPSRLFEREVGLQLALGIEKGFVGGVSKITGPMGAAVSSEMGRFASGIAPSVSGGEGATGGVSAGMTVIFQAPVRTYSETVQALADIEGGLAW
jgi:hypothetical protein